MSVVNDLVENDIGDCGLPNMSCHCAADNWAVMRVDFARSVPRRLPGIEALLIVGAAAFVED